MSLIAYVVQAGCVAKIECKPDHFFIQFGDFSSFLHDFST